MKRVSFLKSISTLLFLVAMLAIGLFFYDSDPHIPIFLATIYAAVISIFSGFTYKEIEDSIYASIRKSLSSILILAIIGILIGTWLDTGVVATMIYYGLSLIKPSFFLVSCVLLSSLVSIATGASWGTIATIGVALMGVGYGLNMPATITAGAIISGAYFGDKMSPLSDTTNLAPAIAGTDVLSHIRFMFKPTIIAYGIALLFFLIVGLNYNSGLAGDLSKVYLMQEKMLELFNINLLFLIPPILVIALVIKKMPVLPSLSIGIIVAGIIGLLFQKNCNIGTLFVAGMNGYSCSSGMKEIDDLFNTGGLMNMMHSISMVILAMAFGGVMEVSKQFHQIVEPLKKFITNNARLIIFTEITCILSNMLMPEQYISVLIPGTLFTDEYEERNLDPLTLSNALESSGTVSSPLIPWNTCGVYIATTLGVSTLQYLPWCIFNYSMPILVAVLAILNIFVIKKKSEV